MQSEPQVSQDNGWDNRLVEVEYEGNIWRWIWKNGN